MFCWTEIVWKENFGYYLAGIVFVRYTQIAFVCRRQIHMSALLWKGICNYEKRDRKRIVVNCSDYACGGCLCGRYQPVSGSQSAGTLRDYRSCSHIKSPDSYRNRYFIFSFECTGCISRDYQVRYPIHGENSLGDLNDVFFYKSPWKCRSRNR